MLVIIFKYAYTYKLTSFLNKLYKVQKSGSNKFYKRELSLQNRYYKSEYRTKISFLSNWLYFIVQSSYNKDSPKQSIQA